ncbi:MAG: 30S ribosomal protein S17 [Nitrososphaerota archaeon]|jgi:small subunit ribosomal protein S17|nr:30S ribosomal protein S17 [Nitrososphaerota archaeon]
MTRKQSILGTKAPSRSCEDPDCPWHGTVSTRGKLVYGRLVSRKARGLAVIERDYYQFVSKYSRYEKRKSRIHAHLAPCISAKEGQQVIAAECRPLSKSISFVVVGAQGE